MRLKTPPRFLTARDIALDLQVSPDTAYRIMRSMIHVRINGVLRVSRENFENFLRQREQLGCVSTSAADSGGVGTIKMAEESAFRRVAKTGVPRKLSCVNGNGEPPIRITLPRTRPRSETQSGDS